MSLFIAVWPDRPTAELLGGLARPSRPGVRWIDPGHWHVTLAFLGPAAAEPAVGAMSRLESEAAPVAELGPTTRLLNRSVLAVPVSGLEELADSARTACRRAGIAVEDRPFRGHLTLARGRRPGDLAGLGGEAVSARIEVSAVDLVSSTRVPGGAPNRYDVLHHIALADPH